MSLSQGKLDQKNKQKVSTTAILLAQDVIKGVISGVGNKEEQALAGADQAYLEHKFDQPALQIFVDGRKLDLTDKELNDFWQLSERYKEEAAQSDKRRQCSGDLTVRSEYRMNKAKWIFYTLEYELCQRLASGFNVGIMLDYFQEVQKNNSSFTAVMPDHELLSAIKYRFEFFNAFCHKYIENIHVDVKEATVDKQRAALIDSLLNNLSHPWVNGAKAEIAILRSVVQMISNRDISPLTKPVDAIDTHYLSVPTARC